MQSYEQARAHKLAHSACNWHMDNCHKHWQQVKLDKHWRDHWSETAKPRRCLELYDTLEGTIKEIDQNWLATYTLRSATKSHK